MKKLSNNIIRIITLVILCTVIINQFVWIRNMYIVYQQEMFSGINEALEKAVFMEINERNEQLGGIAFFSSGYNSPDDKVVQKQVLSADTTYSFRHDKNDPHSFSRILQMLLKDKLPLNIYRLDTIFQEQLAHDKYPIKNVYIEQIKVGTDSVIARNTDIGDLSSYIPSVQIPLDPENTMAVQAYVQTSTGKILENMRLQLALSILLILISVIFIYILANTIFIQREEEKMRQDSINAMTHEFRRPISSAVVQIALIPYYVEENDLNLVKQYAENTLLELNKLTAYTERIQQISNNEKGKIILHPVDIEIVPFFNALADKYSLKTDKEINVSLNLDCKHRFLHADLLHFSNVMDNLMENAIKYSNSTVNILVSVQEEASDFRISVKDDGIGISKNDKVYIFDRFYRSNDKEVRRNAGLGLGLTYVRAIVTEHGGKIEVVSELGKGSEFIIHLPIT